MEKCTLMCNKEKYVNMSQHVCGIVSSHLIGSI